MLLPSGSPIKCHEEFLSSQPMFPPKRFDSFPPFLRNDNNSAFRFFIVKIKQFQFGEFGEGEKWCCDVGERTRTVGPSCYTIVTSYTLDQQ